MEMRRNRAINTVVDVAVALLFVGIAVLVLSAVNLSKESTQEQFDTDRTATVLGTATFDVTYTIEPALEDAAEASDAIEYNDKEVRDQRIAHEPMAAHIGDAAIGNLAVDSERVTSTGEYYQTAIDSQLQTQLAGSQFETSVTAHWEPFPEASVSGRATVGVEPPPTKDIRTRELTIPSGFERTQKDAIAAVEGGGGYAAVAETVASAIIRGYLPVVGSKHALERGGSATILTRYRYERIAALLDETAIEDVREEIEQTAAEPAEANRELTAALATELESDLRQRFESPRAAAQSLSTGTITITVRTWDP